MINIENSTEISKAVGLDLPLVVRSHTKESVITVSSTTTMVGTPDEEPRFVVEVLESEDGGRPSWDAVVRVSDLVALRDVDALKIGNIRPDHEIIGYNLDGSPKYANTSQRIADWSDALIAGNAILGTLSWNLNPDLTEFSVERKDDGKLYLTLRDGAFDTEIDSASRHRAVMRAVRHVRIADGSSTEEADRLMQRKLSVRIYSVRSKHGGSTDIGPNELIAEELFTAMQNWGQSVNQSVTKWNFQKTNVQKMMRKVVDLTAHLGCDNVETRKNSVSANSAKLVAYNTWSMAGEEFWRIPLESEEDVEREATWLAEWWDELVRVRPELGALMSQQQRRLNRENLVSATALGFFGFIALASRMRGEDAEITTLEQLDHKIRLSQKGHTHEKGAVVDFFEFDNPVWEERGVLMKKSAGKDGTRRLGTRNSWQSRRAVAEIILHRCGFIG